MLTVEKKEGKIPLRCQLDCGSTVNCLDLKTYKTLKEDEEPLKKSKSRLRMYNGTIMKPLGTTKLMCTCNGVTRKVKFEVLPEAPCLLLTGDTCEDFGLVSFNKEKLAHLVISEDKMKAGALTKKILLRITRTFLLDWAFSP